MSTQSSTVLLKIPFLNIERFLAQTPPPRGLASENHNSLKQSAKVTFNFCFKATPTKGEDAFINFSAANSFQNISCEHQGRGSGGLVVSVLPFYSDDQSSNLAEDNFLCKMLFEKIENKRRRCRYGSFKKSCKKIM